MSTKHRKHSGHGESYDRAAASQLRGRETELCMAHLTDGTETIIELRGSGPLADKCLGVGFARRRKGEKRDPQLAVALATYRAFADAAERARKDGADRWPGYFPEA